MSTIDFFFFLNGIASLFAVYSGTGPSARTRHGIVRACVCFVWVCGSRVNGDTHPVFATPL